jgi:hypothetical protein
MLPFVLPAKQFQWELLIPIGMTLVLQIWSLGVGDRLLQRMRTELRDSGVPAGQPTESAFQVAQGFNLYIALYSGLVPLLGTLMIVAIGAKVSSTVLVAMIFLLCLFLLVRLGEAAVDVYGEFSLPSGVLSWYEERLARWRIRSYGFLWERVFIVLTFLVQLAVAYLQLPDKPAP